MPAKSQMPSEPICIHFLLVAFFVKWINNYLLYHPYLIHRYEYWIPVVIEWFGFLQSNLVETFRRKKYSRIFYAYEIFKNVTQLSSTLMHFIFHVNPNKAFAKYFESWDVYIYFLKALLYLLVFFQWVKAG